LYVYFLLCNVTLINPYIISVSYLCRLLTNNINWLYSDVDQVRKADEVVGALGIYFRLVVSVKWLIGRIRNILQHIKNWQS